MSGKDEEPDRDIPICPKCGKKPDFWILYPVNNMEGVHGWYWLFSDKYLENYSRFEKMEFHHGPDRGFPELSDIIDIVCRVGNHGGYHHFKPEDPIFQKVVQQVRRLKND